MIVIKKMNWSHCLYVYREQVRLKVKVVVYIEDIDFVNTYSLIFIF